VEQFSSKIFPDIQCNPQVIHIQDIYHKLAASDQGFVFLGTLGEAGDLKAVGSSKLMLLFARVPDVDFIVDIIVNCCKQQGLSANRAMFELQLYDFCVEVIDFFLKKNRRYKKIYFSAESDVKYENIHADYYLTCFLSIVPVVPGVDS